MRSAQLIALQRRLAASNASVITPSTPDLTVLTRHIRSLQARLNRDGAEGSAPPRDRLLEAVRGFISSGTLTDLKHARLTSWALMLVYDPKRVAVIEDELWFARFIAAIDPFRSNPRGFRRCWKALLNIYFSVDPEGAGSTNWRFLREYLNTTLQMIKVEGFTPDWTNFILEHSNLLTNEPAARYGVGLANGDTQILEDLRGVLGVTDDSWLASSLVNAQISAVVDRDDDKFREALPTTIALLEKHKLLADAGLTRLLNRYHSCKNPELNVPLRDYSSARWGPPWLQINSAKWGRVSNDVRMMVDYWLKSDLIEKFFELLSADGVNDPRRLHFWKSLHERNPDLITNMHFALGRNAYSNKSEDFRILRRKMQGIFLELEDATPDNNAFIMKIGEYLLVEFGETGNAMYIYKIDFQPFDLTRSFISLRKLKNTIKMESRNTHTDTKERLWEEKFRVKITTLTGRILLSLGSGVRPQVRATPQPTKAPIAPLAAQGQITQQSVKSFCHLHGLKFDDRTDRGGQLWVFAQENMGHITRDLSSKGFRFSVKKNAWYRPF